jgi:hypothetical protein
MSKVTTIIAIVLIISAITFWVNNKLEYVPFPKPSGEFAIG